MKAYAPNDTPQVQNFGLAEFRCEVTTELAI